MLIFDRLIIGGVRFVLEKVAAAVEAELNDDTALREELIAAAARVELGELSPGEYAQLERDILERLREIRERKEGGPRGPLEFRNTQVEATMGGDSGPIGEPDRE